MINERTRDTIEKQTRLMVVSMTICVFLIFALLIWRDFDNKANKHVLYEYHLTAVFHAEAINASYTRLRPLVGVKEVSQADIVDEENFASAMMIEYEQMVENIKSLLALSYSFRDPRMLSATQRLSQALDELYTLEKHFDTDRFGFAMALAKQDLSIEIVSQQLALQYKITLAEERTKYQSRELYIWVILGVLMVMLIVSTILLWHRSLRVIRLSRSQEEQMFVTLKDSSHRLKEAQRLASIGSWELDIATNKLVWSDETFHIFEVDKEKFSATYKLFLDSIHPDDRDVVNKAYTNSLINHKPYEIVHRLKMGDGRIKYVRESCETSFDATGEPIRSVGTVQDITSLHLVELELHQSEERMRLVLNASNDGIWDWNIDTHEDYLSPRWKEIVGYRDDELPNIESSFFKLIHPDDKSAVTQAVTSHFEKHEPFHTHMRLRHKNGSYRWVLSRGEALRDTDGRPVRMVGAITDITNLKQAEEKLRTLNEELEMRVKQRTSEMTTARNEAERANRAKSEFLSRMSHELRTPMNAILGFSQVLEFKNLPPDQLEYVHEIHRAGDYLLELINELLDLARIETGKMAVVLEPVDVSSAINAAVKIIDSLIKIKQIHFINQCGAGESVLADPTRLKQVLVNLLSNAAKYNHSEGDIKVSCRLEKDLLRLCITDTGPGIPPEKQAQLFQPFERLGAESSEIEGTGIGLAISKQLTELMGGKLEFDSTLGKGSTFWVELPIAPQVASNEKLTLQDEETVTGSQQQLRVLYIEDNPANLRVVEAMFQFYGHLKLISATNGEFGLDLAQRYKPEIILLDIHLPGMDGYAVLDALKADPITHDIPVIALSADAMPIDIERGLKAGFAQYLTKPVKMGVLSEAIERHL